MTIIIIVVFALFSVYELNRLKKEGLKKELLVFCLLTMFALTIALLQIWDVKLPNPNKINELITNKLAGPAIRFLKTQD